MTATLDSPCESVTSLVLTDLGCRQMDCSLSIVQSQPEALGTRTRVFAGPQMVVCRRMCSSQPYAMWAAHPSVVQSPISQRREQRPGGGRAAIKLTLTSQVFTQKRRHTHPNPADKQPAANISPGYAL